MDRDTSVSKSQSSNFIITFDECNHPGIISNFFYIFIYSFIHSFAAPPPHPVTSTAYAGALVGHLITTTLSFKKPLPVALRHEYIYISHLPMIVLLWLMLSLVGFSLFIFSFSLVLFSLIFLFYLLLFLFYCCCCCFWCCCVGLLVLLLLWNLVHHVIFYTCDVIGFRFKHHCQRYKKVPPPA